MIAPELVYTSPNKFSFTQRLILSTAPVLAGWILKAVFATCRVRTIGIEHWQSFRQSGRHVLVAIWHESLLIAAWQFRNTGFHTLTSYSFDGELAARLVRRFGLFALRGSSSRGGMHAIAQLTAATKTVPAVGFTVDGPRGPRREVKPGIAILAAKSGLPVLTNYVYATRCWRMKSWDRLAIPKPFSEIVVAFGPPISPPETVQTPAIETCRAAVERELLALTRRVESGEPEPL